METRLRRILGDVIIAGDHGIYLDHDGKRFYVVDMDGDGRVVSREPFDDPNAALEALKDLREYLDIQKFSKKFLN